MKGSDRIQPALLTTITLESYVAQDHKLREVRRVVNDILASCEPEFASMYSANGRPSIAPDKLYDQTAFVDGCRNERIVPHVAQNDKTRRSRIDGRTTKSTGYETSQKIRKRIEEIFGWMKTVGGLRKLRYRGIRRVNWIFVFCSAAFNLVRMTNIAAKQG